MQQMHLFWLDTFCLLELDFVTGGRHIVVFSRFCCMQHNYSVGRPCLYRSFVPFFFFLGYRGIVHPLPDGKESFVAGGRHAHLQLWTDRLIVLTRLVFTLLEFVWYLCWHQLAKSGHVPNQVHLVPLPSGRGWTIPLKKRRKKKPTSVPPRFPACEGPADPSVV